jgi:diaminopimelate decarboxylase
MKTKKVIQHTAMNQFSERNGQLLVNGMPLSQLKLRAGQTPFYAYDRSIILNKIEQFRSVMPASLKLHYAMKANPMPALVDFIVSHVDGLDIASGGELNTALNSGMPSGCVSFAGPGKQVDELEMAVACGITINVESFCELQRINRISQQTGLTAKVAIRVNPNFELKSSGMKMGGGAQQFGVDSEHVPDMMQQISQFGLSYQGLHIFTGSQNLNSGSIIQTHKSIFELASQLQRSSTDKILNLNIGGGLGIPYFPGEKSLSIEPIGQSLEPLMNEFIDEFGATEVSMELGRYLTGECGVYVAEIIDIKISRGKTFVIIDGGMNHHLSASGNFGQVIRKNYPVALGNKMSQTEKHPVQVVGPLCTPLDLMGNQVMLPQAEIGDLIVIYQSGAYGFSASPRDFLSQRQPVEMLV